jgi:hypothetical protein
VEAVAREPSDVTGAPHDRGLGRVVRIVVVAGVVVVALWAAAIATWKPAAVEHGETLLGHRHAFREKFTPSAATTPRIVWLGDSTIVHASYPQLLEPWLEKTYGVESRIAAAAGMTTYNYYALMGSALDLHPTMIVFLANLRMFATHRPNGTPVAQFGDDLASMIPASELPRALTLPWMARSISLARLLLLRALQLPLVERAVVLTEGLGDCLQARSPWELVAAPPPPMAPSVAFGVFFAGLHIQAELYDVRITSRQPYVQMMAAAIRMAKDRDVPVVVIASPIPVDNLKAFGLGKETFAPRFAKLREIAETGGATFLDYHDALARASFADNVGHYTPEGASLFAETLKAPLGSALTAALARRAPN